MYIYIYIKAQTGWHKGLQDLWSHPILQSLTAKQSKSCSGKEYDNPTHCYCYKSVVQSLEGLVKRTGFEEKCE